MLRAAVIGAGLMGHGIAQVVATAGWPVVVHDPDPGSLASVGERIRANLRALDLDPAIADRVRSAPDLAAAVADAEIVFEAAPERLELKRELFAAISSAVAPGAILASNTSVISIGEIARDADDPGRVVGTHWWNPPYLVPLVEVVQAEHTRAETVARTMEALRALGKAPVHVRRDIPGFIGNRLQHALWREAFALIDAGVCDPETVDEVIRTSFGPRLAVLGPVENADLVGLDLTLAIHDYLLPALAAGGEPSSTLRARVAGGDLGMRTGRGLRSWPPGAAEETRRRVTEHLRRGTP